MLISASANGEVKPATDGNITARIRVHVDGGNAVALNELYSDTITLSVSEEQGSL